MSEIYTKINPTNTLVTCEYSPSLVVSVWSRPKSELELELELENDSLTTTLFGGELKHIRHSSEFKWKNQTEFKIMSYEKSALL